MTIQILRYNLLLTLVFIGFQASALFKADQEKRKLLERNFTATQGKVLIVDNKFGDIHVESWDKNQIDVKVEIVAKGKNEERALKIMSKISVDMKEDDHSINLETDAGGLEINGNSEAFEIHYTIIMNAKNPIQFENKFGNIYLPNRIGDTEIAIKYGNLKAGDMIGEFDLELAFGGANINELISAEIDIQYSNITIDKIKRLEMEQKFSNLYINEVYEIDLNTKYGEANFGKLKSGVIEAHYSGFKIDLLETSLIFEGNYVPGFYIKKLSKDFEKLDMAGQYSSYKVGLEEGLKAEIEAEFSYAELIHSGIDIDFYYKDVDGNTKEYRGSINGGDKNRIISIDSTYGNLKLL